MDSISGPPFQLACEKRTGRILRALLSFTSLCSPFGCVLRRLRNPLAKPRSILQPNLSQATVPCNNRKSYQ